MIRISLTQEDFEALVNGESIIKEGIRTTTNRTEGVEIILQDIGFIEMDRAIRKAWAKG